MSNICGVSEGLSGGPWSPLFPKEHLFIDDNRRRPYSTAALSGRAFPSPSLRLSVPVYLSVYSSVYSSARVCLFVCIWRCPRVPLKATSVQRSSA